MSTLNLVWRKEYELGVDSIDHQHHYFVDLINRLSLELVKVEEPKRRAYLIRELNAYARFHFISEENLMRRLDYPLLEQHQSHHRELINQLSAKEAKLEFEKNTESVEEIIEFLTDWFFVHTRKEDRLFVDFIEANKANLNG